MKDFYTPIEAAKLVGLSAAMVRHLVRSGLLRGQRRGLGQTGRIVIPGKEVARLRKAYGATSVPLAPASTARS